MTTVRPCPLGCHDVPGAARDGGRASAVCKRAKQTKRGGELHVAPSPECMLRADLPARVELATVDGQLALFLDFGSARL